MSGSNLDPAGPWRFDQLADLPDDDGRRYEVVDGHLVVTPPPSQRHQTVAGRLREQLAAAAPREWEVLTEFPLALGTDGRVPDLAIVRRRPLAPTSTGLSWMTPEQFGLVVEVTSPSTRKTDLFAKPGEYAEAGIPLFWRVETEPDLAVHAFRLLDGSYADAGVVRRPGGAGPAPWGRVHIDLERIVTG